ncbi:MAG: hypothetical protein KC636_11860 [Myxococcales bacterium]|nr:hypothetical protein [Myxococcales bacterium]
MLARGRFVLLTALMILSFGSCIAPTSSTVSGELTVKSDEFGEWRYAPTRCYSGEPGGFFGVDLIEGPEGSDRIVRVVEDPIDGAALRINVPGEELSLVVEQDGCRDWDVQLDRTNTRVNYVWNMDGHVEVSCAGEGVTIDASLAFVGCH